jgi:hypothetical protein
VKRRFLVCLVVGACSSCTPDLPEFSSLTLTLDAKRADGAVLNQKGKWELTSPVSGEVPEGTALSEKGEGVFFAPPFFAPETPDGLDFFKAEISLGDLFFAGPAAQGEVADAMGLALVGGGQASRWPLSVTGADAIFEDETFFWIADVEAELSAESDGHDGAPPFSLEGDGSASGTLKVGVDCAQKEGQTTSVCPEKVPTFENATCSIESGDCPLPIANAFLGDGPGTFDGDTLNMGAEDIACVEQSRGGHFCHARLERFEAGGCVWDVQLVGLSALAGKVMARGDPGCEPRHCNIAYRCHQGL